MFINNSDWTGNNLKVWRYNGEPITQNEYIDDKYRYLLYDTEFSFGLLFGIEDTYNVNSFDIVSDLESYEWPNPWWSNILYSNLMENEKFKRRFLTTLADYLNSRFSVETITNHVTEFKELYKPEMEEYINRYYFFDVPNVEMWENTEVQRLVQFAELRNDYMFASAKDYYSIKDYYTLSINEFSNGHLVVNDNYSISFREENDNENVTYFSDYLISIEAVPEEGYQFIGWIINETDSGTNIMKPGETSVRNNNYETIYNKILIKPDSNITIKPIFN